MCVIFCLLVKGQMHREFVRRLRESGPSRHYNVTAMLLGIGMARELVIRGADRARINAGLPRSDVCLQVRQTSLLVNVPSMP